MAVDYVEAGRRLRKRREDKGWSRRHLSEQAQVSESALRYMEQGERPDDNEYRPSKATLRRVAEAFGYPDGVEVLEDYAEPAMARQLERDLIAVEMSPLDRLNPHQRQTVLRIEELIVRLLLEQEGRA